MNRPGINISMFGVFTTDLTVFVVFDLMFRPKAQRVQKASQDHDRSHNLVSKASGSSQFYFYYRYEITCLSGTRHDQPVKADPWWQFS